MISDIGPVAVLFLSFHKKNERKVFLLSQTKVLEFKKLFDHQI